MTLAAIGLADVLAALIAWVGLAVLFLGVWAFLSWVHAIGRDTWNRRPRR